jgi:toxin ParE1/3/4
MKVVWSEFAAHDLKDIFEYISHEDPEAALRVVTFIRETADRLVMLSDRGKPGRWPGTRELVITTYGFIVPYRVHDGEIEILSVFHHAREWPSS